MAIEERLDADVQRRRGAQQWETTCPKPWRRGARRPSCSCVSVPASKNCLHQSLVGAFGDHLNEGFARGLAASADLSAGISALGELAAGHQAENT